MSARYLLKVDFHCHTADDPCDPIPHTATDLVQRAASLNFDALAITLHDRQYQPTQEVSDLARTLNVTLIGGVERTIHGRHVLLINFPAERALVRSFTELADLRRAHPDGLVIAPHPFFPLGNCLRELADSNRDLFDAVEYNGCYTALTNFNRGAVKWAEEYDKPMVGCSDAHRLSVLGLTYSLVEASGRSTDAICAAVKRGNVHMRTAPLSTPAAALYFGSMILNGRGLPLRRVTVGNARTTAQKSDHPQGFTAASQS